MASELPFPMSTVLVVRLGKPKEIYHVPCQLPATAYDTKSPSATASHCDLDLLPFIFLPTCLPPAVI